MRSLRFSIAWLMGVVLLAAIVLAALATHSQNVGCRRRSRDPRSALPRVSWRSLPHRRRADLVARFRLIRLDLLGPSIPFLRFLPTAPNADHRRNVRFRDGRPCQFRDRSGRFF